MAGNATMTALALGIDPEPLGVAPFVMSTAQPPIGARRTSSGLELHPRARATLFPALGAYVGGDIVAGMLATGMDRDKRTRLFIDVGTNCEIVLSDGDTILVHRGAGRAGVRGRRDPLRHAGRRRRDRGDPARPRRATAIVELGVIGDVEPRGLCGSGLVDAVAELVRIGLLDSSGRFVPDDVAAEIAPALADRLTADRGGAGVRPAPARRRTPTSRRPSTSPSATYASCSSPRPRSPPAGRCCSRSSASSTATSSRCCWPVRSAATSPPPPPSGSGWCPSCRCCASSRPATSPARARRWRCCRCASAPERRRCWRR